MSAQPEAEQQVTTTVSPIGLHHVTAIASAPWQNVEFYTRVLGLRLVKRTVNFDDPGTYHLYYGDEQGSPSTLLTFFSLARRTPWQARDRSGYLDRVQRARQLAGLLVRATGVAGGQDRRTRITG